MRKRLGIICMILGLFCLLGAIGVVVYNYFEAENAAQVSQSLLQEVRSIITENKKELPPEDTGISGSEIYGEVLDEEIPEMPTVPVKGYDCIGILSIPTLELELPVLTDWSYTKLKKAPCLYYGSYYTQDFVIAAHNYRSHFGNLSQLQTGDPVLFTAADGTVYYYEVVLSETLPPAATEEMIASGFDLSLYTCTPGGGSRVTVRCEKK